MEKVSLSTEIGKDTAKRLDDYSRESGMKKGHIIEKAIDNYIPAPAKKAKK